MRKRGRFLYTHKLAALNVLLMVFILGYDPRWLKHMNSDFAFMFYAGVLVLVSLFLEFAGIYFKTRFIYSHTGAKEKKIPALLQLLFFPRVFISGASMAFAFSGLGWLQKSDFILLIIAAYATGKEFWVRATLVSPENAPSDRRSEATTLVSEMMLFLYMVVLYMAFWQIFLWDNDKLLYLIKNPINFGFVVAAFGLVLFSVQLPYLVEIAMRTQYTRRRWGALFTMMLPIAALLAQLYRLGHMNF
jgi:hypothetical protein